MQSDLIGVGPALGSLLATAVYTILRTVHYEEINGSQDRDAQLVPDRGDSTGVRRRDVTPTSSTGISDLDTEGRTTRADPARDRFGTLV